MTVNRSGHLEIEGWDAVDLAEKYGTPLFVTSENTIRSNYRQFDQAFKSRYSRVLVCCEHKVNDGLAVKKILQSEGAGANTSSRTQLYMAQLTGYDPNKVMLSGCNKSEESLREAIQANVIINVDNLEELEMLNRIAAEVGKLPRICVRLKLPFHGYEDSVKVYRKMKEGMNTWTGHAFKACERALNMKNVQLVGFQHHKGGYTETEICREAVEEIMDFAGEIKSRLGWEPQYVDLGGGWVNSRAEGYGPGKKYAVAPSIDEYAETVTSTMKEKAREHGITEPTLILEPGQWITANATVLLGRVGVVKEFPGDGKWVIVDASVNQVPRVWQSEWYYHILAANKADAAPVETVCVGGPLQSWNDYLGLDRKLPKVERGDLIALLDVGSYAESCDSQYCSYPRPASILVSKDHVDLIRRRETIYDLIAREIIPTRLL